MLTDVGLTLEDEIDQGCVIGKGGGYKLYTINIHDDTLVESLVFFSFCVKDLWHFLP